MPPDYRRDNGRFRVVKTVHIEAMRSGDPIKETRWLDEIAPQFGLPSAIVGDVSFDHDNAADILAGHAQSPLARGVRNYPAAAPTPAKAKRGSRGSMDDPKWRRGYALLDRHRFHFDVQTPWWHLDALAELAADFPADADRHLPYRLAGGPQRGRSRRVAPRVGDRRRRNRTSR